MLTIFYKVFNEADFLEESLGSVYNYADRIVVLEYCLDSMRQIIHPDRVTEAGLSIDGTSEIVKSFPDPDNKIEYRPVGFIPGAESIPYQMIVDLAEVGEYIWVLDGDIVYPKELAINIREMVDSGEYDVIWVPERVFYHDLYHEKHLFFAHHQRVFKNPDETAFYYPKNFEVHWMDGDDGFTDKAVRWYIRDSTFTMGKKEYHGKFCDPANDGWAFHYALVRDVQKILEKLLWQYNMIDRRWNNTRERKVCANYKDPLEFKIKTHDWFLNHEPEHRRRYDGKHPDVMCNNKWMEYYWPELPTEITYNEARALIGNPGRC